MLTIFFQILSFVMGIRSLLLAFLEKKHWSKQLFDIGLAVFYLSTFIFLFIATDHDILNAIAAKLFLLVILSTIVGFTLFLRLKKKKKSGFMGPFFKTFIFTCYLLISFCLFGFSLMRRFTEDRPLFKVVLTGQYKKEIVEWQNPNASLNKEVLTTYEVKLESMEGKDLGSFFILGEQVAIRAKVIRFKPFLYALGLQNLYAIDGIFNGYKIPENPHPLKAYAFAKEQSAVPPFVWKCWESLFLQETSSMWIKSATLESTYFPLIDNQGKPFQGSYLLTLTEGGLSSIPEKK